jgi:hypothetical protein
MDRHETKPESRRQSTRSEHLDTDDAIERCRCDRDWKWVGGCSDLGRRTQQMTVDVVVVRQMKTGVLLIIPIEGRPVPKIACPVVHVPPKVL